MSRIQAAPCLDDLRDLARERLSRPVRDFIQGGARSEAAVRANRESRDHVRLLRRVLAGHDDVRTEVSVLGSRLAMPVMPVACQRLAHPAGELATGPGRAGGWCADGREHAQQRSDC